MTTKEEKAIQELKTILCEIKQENNNFKSLINTKIEDLKFKVENKHVPINLEHDILSTIQTSINTTIKNVLQSCNSPLGKLIEVVINKHSEPLKVIMSEAFNEAISTLEFKDGIRTAFAHKVAKTIISNHDGLYDKISNELKQDAIFRAKAIVAISNIVAEFLNKS